MKRKNRPDEQAEKSFRHSGRKYAAKLSLWAAAVLVAAAILPGTAPGEGRPLKLMIVTDIHYLSPSLYENSDGAFESALKKGDGKMVQYSRELLEGLMQEVRHQEPDALIVSGDLSFNGEKASHTELAAAFARLRGEGFPVWVIPGNHDINDPYAGGFAGNRYVQVPNVSPGDFQEIYSACMIRDNAGKGHMSYTVSLNEWLRLAMCDVCVYDPAPASGGYYSEETGKWLQAALEEAKAAGARVITVTHQSMIPHTDFMKSAMTVENGGQMTQQIREAGNVRLNLSGHLHIQHIAEDDGIHDIATGAFSVPPFRYGLLTVREDGTAEYQAGSLCREHLPQEAAMRAETWFEEIVIEKERPQLQALGIPEGDRDLMLHYAARLNHAYFSGEFVSTDAGWTDDPAFALWTDLRGRDPFADYLTKLPGSPENSRSALNLILDAED